VTHEQPGATEQAIHFQIENFRIGVDTAVDAAGFY
jgi:hypothetical protein